MHSLRRIIGNATSLLISDVVNRATTFILYALIARHLGVFEFGQMSLALTLFYIFQVLAATGLKTLITREVARDKKTTERYFVNGSLIVVVSFLLSITILLLFLRLMNYTAGTTSVILLLSLGLLPFALSAVSEAVFQAWERMHYIVYANVPVNIAKVSLIFLLLSRGYGLYHLIMLLLASFVAITCLEWSLMLQHIVKPQLRIDLRFALTMIRSTSTFLGIDIVVAISSSVGVVLLSKLAGEAEVGFYSAAAQLLVPLMLVFQGIALSFFPMMCRKFDLSPQSLKGVSEHLLELLLVIALPTAVGLFFLADSVLLMLYGDKDFLLASGVLRIVVWTVIPTALTATLGQVLLASLHEKMTLRIVAIDALISLTFGLILISQFGLIGAAITILLVRIADFFQHYVTVSKQISEIALGRVIWKPVVASTCMAVYLAVVKGQGILATVVYAGALYTVVLLALILWSIGGPRQFKARYMYLWSEV